MLGHGDWMDDVVIHEDRVIKDGHIQPADRPGLGLELNPDVVKAHVAQGESYWDQDRRGYEREPASGTAGLPGAKPISLRESTIGLPSR